MKPNGLHTIEQLQQRCQQNRHRGLVVVSGSQGYANKFAFTVQRALSQLDFHSINDPVTATALLGDETDSIIFNAYNGLNLNALAICAGTIKAGGLLVLLCPSLETWADFNDPEYERLLAHPYTAADVDGRFLQRFRQQLQIDTHVLIINEKSQRCAFALPDQNNYQQTESPAPFANQQQANAVKHIFSGIDKEHDITVVTADRGRGKSAALGLAAAELLQQNHRHILLTAPSPKATQAVFKHASGNNIENSKIRLSSEKSHLQFISPDDLVLNKPPAHLVFIDEAAALPVPVLLEILTHYPRAVLTTTVHGYEGTGRAFAERFGKLLDQHGLAYSRLELEQPIRYASDDPLEAFIHRSLLLDSSVEAEEIANQVHNNIECSVVDRDILISDEYVLREIFGLLMLAHYKTRPDDLRHLMDAPNLDLFIMKSDQGIVGTAMVAREGQLDNALITAIMAGKRRPKGHLLPQTLAFYCELPNAATLSSARVIRIAIQPKLQRQGLGKQLLDFIENHYQSRQTDLIGSSFGLEPGVLSFWQQAGYDCVRVGHKRHAASGYHSGLLLKSLSVTGANIQQKAVYQYQRANELSTAVEDKR